jgi:ABC-type proline/glycine betaine transport system permease subunit
MPTVRALFAHLPELTVAVLVAAPLPGLVGLLSAVRWLRRRPGGTVSPLAAATRWATILAILGLALPFNAVDQASAVSALVLRGSHLVALLFLFDGPLVPEDRG